MGNPEASLLTVYERKEEGLSPYELFRTYSSEEQALSAKLSRILVSDARRFLGETPIELLDVGAGDPRHQLLMTTHIRELGGNPFSYTWLEQNDAYADGLRALANTMDRPSRARVAHSSWDTYKPDQLFDYVVLSQMIYYWKRDEFDAQLRRFLSYAKPGGKLVIVARERDDGDYQFLERFWSVVTRKPFDEITIEDAEASLARIGVEPGRIATRHTESYTIVPYRTEPAVTKKLLEFYFGGTRWENIGPRAQRDIITYLDNPLRGGQISQGSKILLVRA